MELSGVVGPEAEQQHVGVCTVRIGFDLAPEAINGLGAWCLGDAHGTSLCVTWQNVPCHMPTHKPSRFLTGSVVDWEARATIPAHGHVDQVLFAGQSHVDGSGGVWRIRHAQVDGEELARVEWERCENFSWQIDLRGRGMSASQDSTYARYHTDGSSRKLWHRETVTSHVRELDVSWDTLRRSGYLQLVGPPDEHVCWGEVLENAPCAG
jgi:hypothetical protein